MPCLAETFLSLQEDRAQQQGHTTGRFKQKVPTNNSMKSDVSWLLPAIPMMFLVLYFWVVQCHGWIWAIGQLGVHHKQYASHHRLGKGRQRWLLFSLPLSLSEFAKRGFMIDHIIVRSYVSSCQFPSPHTPKGPWLRRETVRFSGRAHATKDCGACG